jgi:hypothetical protein
MEIKIDALVKAIKLIRSDNSDEFKKFFQEQNTGDQNEILDNCANVNRYNANSKIDLRDYR